MTHRFTTTALALALATALSATALAGPRGHLKAADTNQDGEVSLTEFSAQRELHFLKMDVDADGIITKEERQASRQARQAEKVTEHFNKMDANGDGFVSRDEFDNGQDGLKKRKHKFKKRKMKMGDNDQRPPRRHFQRDANEDGMIDRAEYDTATQSMFTKLDTNQDGVLTKSDRKDRKHMRTHRGE